MSRTIYAVGDGATGNTDSAFLAARIASQNPDAFLWLGDVYESGTAQEFAANYRPSWGELDNVAWPIPGNHDWPNYQTGFYPYFAASERLRGRLTEAVSWYSFELAGWTFLMLNSEAPMDAGSDQYRWAEGHIGFGRQNIACWHRPRYCSGSHGDALDTDPLWQLLAPRCPVILGGHAHNAQVFKPDAAGCRQVVSGAGGRGLYAEIPGDPRLEWGEASGYAACRLDLGTVTLRLAFEDHVGTELYSLNIAA